MIVINTIGVPTYLWRVTCSHCSFKEEAATKKEIDTLRFKVRTHVKQRRHTVSIEKRSGIIYEPVI